MFELAVCAEMVFLGLPFEQRVQRIADSGFQVEIWNWTVTTSTRWSDGRPLLIHGGAHSWQPSRRSRRQRPAPRCGGVSRGCRARLGCSRLVVFGTKLGPTGCLCTPSTKSPSAMWLNAYRTLCRLAELGERAGKTFCLENLNTVVDHAGAPFARAQDTLALVEAVARPGLRMMLDLYHAQIVEGNLIELLERANSLSARFRLPTCPAGASQAQAIAAALKKIGYSDTVGLEVYAAAEDDVAIQRLSSTFDAGAPPLRMVIATAADSYWLDLQEGEDR
jgi:hydroxypyruvate isomerase